eukprot:CAMPEP_0116134758 /NCGR_PEP_ID=MMETSP0329-20121206/10821_1 /TAXON_ID=697910 /ORGANISM="Pseudo-nitzschia arenysensis, Strain B593" /LENGTH=299 /DNA_ID=CAMNT_0003629499 /DNA_START=80 /DNA_END=979 /DNA_ORIENTATION=+
MKISPLRISSQRREPGEQDYRTQDEIIIPLLAQRSFHLPGNNKRQDWIQWMKNNHIIFGTCLHHPLHPIETWERMIVLLGSISFAMVATNIGYIWDWYDGDQIQFDPQEVVYSWDVNLNNDDDDVYTTLNITYGTLILWTFGCTFHSLFDFFVWNLSACSCCHPGGRFAKTESAGRCRDVGSFVLIPMVLSLMALAGYSSYLRVTNRNETLEEEYEDDLVDNLTAGKLGEYSFLVRFGVELFLAWFVYFPIISTIFFSGIFGCGGRIPLLGGRPRDKRLLEQSLKSTMIVPNGHNLIEV